MGLPGAANHFAYKKENMEGHQVGAGIIVRAGRTSYFNMHLSISHYHIIVGEKNCTMGSGFGSSALLQGSLCEQYFERV